MLRVGVLRPYQGVAPEQMSTEPGSWQARGGDPAHLGIAGCGPHLGRRMLPMAGEHAFAAADVECRAGSRRNSIQQLRVVMDVVVPPP
jgi:hypothetical protein